MSERIEVGDLVMVVKPERCCGDTSSIGRVFTVVRMERSESVCNYCNHWFPASLDATGSLRDGDWFDLKILRRIPPLSAPDTVTERDEVNA